jgi:hypothetical protein
MMGFESQSVHPQCEKRKTFSLSFFPHNPARRIIRAKIFGAVTLEAKWMEGQKEFRKSLNCRARYAKESGLKWARRKPTTDNGSSFKTIRMFDT